MKAIEEILGTPYGELTQEELDQVATTIKNRKGSLTVYEYICKILGDNNPAKKREISELIEMGDSASLTVADFWRLFEFKRSMHDILMKNVKGKTIRERQEAIIKMTFEERIEMVKKYSKNR